MTMTGDTPLRQSNTDRAADSLKPDFLKSDAEKLGDSGKHTLDNVASYLPGQAKARDAVNPDAANPTHDTGRGGLGTTGDALKPAGQQTVGEWASTKADQLGSVLEPNSEKSVGQTTHDTITPGNDSTFTPHGPNTTGQGVLGTIGQKVVDAKDAVVGALGGAADGAPDGAKRDPTV